MRLHLLECQQWLPIGVSDAWTFFSTPLNLARITPPEMRFEMLPPFDIRPLSAGQRIRYSVQPLFGIALKWETLISEVDAPHRFVDMQLKGPFALWEHTHTFVQHENGTMMTDHVRYALPLGLLGDLAHAMVVGNKVKDIFVHRRRTLEQIFRTQAA